MSQLKPGNRLQWFRNRVLPWFGLAAAVLLLGFAIRTAWPRNSAETTTLELTAGNRTGARWTIASFLSRSARGSNLNLRLVESAGSEAAIEKVNHGEMDLALVQGGLDALRFPNVRRVATLHVEPLHLLVRASLYSDVQEHITALRGKRINLSVPGSGTHQLASDVLRFLQVRSDDFRATTLSYQELTDPQLDDLPDAVFTVSSLPSPVAQHLISQRGYRLISLPFADSFHLHWFESGTDSKVNRRRTTAAVIPMFAYQVDPPRPEARIETFGTRLELIARKSLTDDIVDALCRVAYESEFKRVSGNVIDSSLMRSESTFALHSGAKAYLDRLSPVSAGRMIEVTEQLVGIFGAALGGLLFLWQWLKRSRERRRDREFVSCVEAGGRDRKPSIAI